MRWSVLGITLAVLLGCREDFEYRPEVAGLRFSTDTLVLDTTFVDISSSTYSFKVFNSSGEDVQIPHIALEGGIDSPYRLNVDGTPGKYFEDIVLRSRDSMYVFVEFTTEEGSSEDPEFAVEDRVIFEDEQLRRGVTLITFVKTARFLYKGYPHEQEVILEPDEIESLPYWIDPEEIYTLSPGDLNWNSSLSTVIYGYARIPSGETLEITEGSRIYFHSGSGLIVPDGSHLRVQGAVGADRSQTEKQVRFLPDRLRPAFSDTPGQWDGIFLSGGSRATLDHSLIKNANFGLAIWTPEGSVPAELDIQNTEILQCSFINLWSRNSMLNSQNCVFGNSGVSSVYIEGGGPHYFRHTTIANYWTLGFRPLPALFMGPFTTATGTIRGLTGATSFHNSIVSGNRARELGIELQGTGGPLPQFESCLLQFEASPQELVGPYDFNDSSLYRDVLLNGDPDFQDPFENFFQIGADSDAINWGQSTNPGGDLLRDLRGQLRIPPPDSGAYEYTGEEPVRNLIRQ